MPPQVHETSPRSTFPEFIAETIRSWQKSYKMKSARNQNQFASRQESKDISAAKEAQREIFFLEVTMAFMHHESQECTKSELDLFTIPATQTSISKTQWIEYHPISKITDSGQIKFDVSGTGDEYLDLARTQLLLKPRSQKQMEPP